MLQIIMEADVEGLIGAGRHERSAERTTWRNGYRDRTLETRLGPLSLKVPKLRQGSCFPGFLEPRKLVEKALVAMIQGEEDQGTVRGTVSPTNGIAGVSTRKVDEPVQAMGMSGISKSSVSELCREIDERVGAFLDRPLDGEWRAPAGSNRWRHTGAPVARRDLPEGPRGRGSAGARTGGAPASPSRSPP